MSRRIKVLIDVPEPRPVKGRLAVGADGSTWDFRPGTAGGTGVTANKVWIDPCTSTAMLAPLPVTAAWPTTFTGNYARHQYSDWTGTDISKWSGFHVSKNTNDTAIRMDQATTAAIELVSSLPSNCPIWFRYYRNQAQDPGDDIILVAGFNVGAGGSAPNNFSVQIKFRSNGSISVFKSNVLEATYDRSGSNFSSARAYTSIFNPAKKWVNVMIIPFRTRELLIWTDNGTCCVHTFEGLSYPNDVSANPILPSGKFTFEVPSGKIAIQSARCYFEQEGYIIGPSKTFRYAPTAGEWSGVQYQTYSDNFGDGATFPTLTTSVVEDTGAFPAFAGNGTRDKARIKVAWSGSSGGTNAGVYCADAWVDQPASATYDGTIDITTAVESLGLSVEEDGRASLNMSCRMQKLLDLSVPKPAETGDRPIAIQISSPKTGAAWVDIFRGTLSPPEVIYEQGPYSFENATLRFTGVDRFGDFDVTMFPESVPNDNNTIAQFFDKVFPVAGYSTSTYLSANYTSSFTVPFSADISRGNYAMVPKRGDYVGGYITGFRDEYFATWYLGWRPTSATSPTGGYKFQVSDPASVGTSSIMTVYQTTQDAITWGGFPAYLAPQKTVRSLRRYYESPEANQVTVIGQDPKTNRLLPKTYIDTASQTPGTAPASRPDNWRGRPIQYILTNENLTTQSAVNSAAQLLYNRLGTGRYMVEFESDLLTWYNPAPVKARMRPSASATVTNGNATIACVNDFANGTRIVLTSTVGNLTAGTTYYVVNRTATTIQLESSVGSGAITPNAGGTTTAQAPWLEGTNSYAANAAVTLEVSMGGFAQGTTYYVRNPTGTLFQLSATSGGAFIAPTDSGTVYVFDGTQHTNVVWIGDTLGISLQESIANTEPLLLDTYQIIAIPQITLVKESTSDDTFHVRSCVYRGLAKDVT
jgi:hypothetical protein